MKHEVKEIKYIRIQNARFSYRCVQFCNCSQLLRMSEEGIDTVNSVGHLQDGEVNAEAIQDDDEKHVAQGKETSVQYKTNSEKLVRAKELKEIGNTLFKSGDTKNAVKKYHHALMFIKGISSSDLGIPGLPSELMNEKATEEERQMGDELTVLIHNNIAGKLPQ